MSEKRIVEKYCGVVIDSAMMTATEFAEDHVVVYDLKDLLDRLDGMEGVNITIEYHDSLPCCWIEGVD
jgi:hypothetical protein